MYKYVQRLFLYAQSFTVFLKGLECILLDTETSVDDKLVRTEVLGGGIDVDQKSDTLSVELGDPHTHRPPHTLEALVAN